MDYNVTGKILPYEHWCADGCGEILFRNGGLIKVRRYKVVLDSGAVIGRLFASQEEAEAFIKEHADA